MIPDKDLTDDVLDEIIAGSKTSMEQYLALSLKAEREVWRKEGPTDDERIMAIEGIIPPISAGNSPGIPGAEQRIADAVELLKQAAPAMLADNSGPDGPLAGRMKSPVIPEWIPVSERMPEEGQHIIIFCDGAFVLSAQCRDGEFFDVVRDGEEFFETVSRCVTHWQPMPAAPQEVK